MPRHFSPADGVWVRRLGSLRPQEPRCAPQGGRVAAPASVAWRESRGARQRPTRAVSGHLQTYGTAAATDGKTSRSETRLLEFQQDDHPPQKTSKNRKGGPLDDGRHATVKASIIPA
jgi:hypothetical protein